MARCSTSSPVASVERQMADAVGEQNLLANADPLDRRAVTSLRTIQDQLRPRRGPGQPIRRYKEQRGGHDVGLLAQERVTQLAEQTL